MYFSRPSRRLVCCFLSMALAMIFGAPPAVAKPTPLSCTDAIFLDLDESFRWTAGSGKSSPLLALPVGAGDSLALEAYGIEGDASPTWLEVTQTTCGNTDETAPRVLSFLDRGLLEIESSGTLLVRIGPTQESTVPAELRLSSHLLTASPMAGYKDGDPGDNTEEEDLEILPLAAGGDHQGAAVRQADLEDEIPFAKDGGPGDDTEEEDLEILPLQAPDSCQGVGAGIEPANDVLYCAQPVSIGDIIEAGLTAVDGFDRDYFSFYLGSLETVVVETSSQLTLRTSILDFNGRPVAAEEIQGSGTLMATLGAGRYYLRVEGEGDGGYRLALHPGSMHRQTD